MNYLIINAKLYDESANQHLKELVDACNSLKDIAEEKGVKLILAPEVTDLDLAVNKITTFSQHVDPVLPGSHTGFISPHHVAEKGVKGTILNHSEHQITLDKLSKTIPICKDVNLQVCVCARTPEEIKDIVKLNPDLIAFEPKELIGGEVSVSTKQPESIIEAKNNSGSIPLLVGAGVKTTNDVSKAIELGSNGILVASGIVKAEDKEKAIKKLLDGF